MYSSRSFHVDHALHKCRGDGGFLFPERHETLYEAYVRRPCHAMVPILDRFSACRFSRECSRVLIFKGDDEMRNQCTQVCDERQYIYIYIYTSLAYALRA